MTKFLAVSPVQQLLTAEFQSLTARRLLLNAGNALMLGLSKTLVLTFCWFAVFTLLNLSRCVFGQFWSVHHAHPQPEWLNDMDLQLVSLKLT